jgi:hypothetical protein
MLRCSVASDLPRPPRVISPRRLLANARTDPRTRYGCQLDHEGASYALGTSKSPRRRRRSTTTAGSLNRRRAAVGPVYASARQARPTRRGIQRWEMRWTVHAGMPKVIVGQELTQT